MSYRQAMDTAWFKEHVQSMSRDIYWLDENSDVELGEPVILHPTLTGFVGNPIKKRRIKSYDNASPGVDMAIGVSLDIRYSTSGVSNDEKILRPDKYWPREITVMKLGIAPIINTHTGIEAIINDTAIPSNGGAESIRVLATGVRAAATTLGKWLQSTEATRPGLLFVNPQSFELYPST